MVEASSFGSRTAPSRDWMHPMRAFAALLAVTSSFVVVAAIAACNNIPDAHPTTAPTATAPPQYGYYPPPQQPYGYPAQQPPPGYPPPGYPTATAYPTYAPPAPAPAPAPAPTYAPPAPAPAPAPTAPPAPAPAPTPAPTASSSLSVPGPLALPCQSDAQCGLHHCNTQYGKCVFPCQTGADCSTNNCMMGVCAPGH